MGGVRAIKAGGGEIEPPFIQILNVAECQNCRLPIPTFAYDEHLVICKKYNKREDTKYEQFGKRKLFAKKHDRTCKGCGKKCWPNYFYCNKCHTGITYMDGSGYIDIP